METFPSMVATDLEEKAHQAHEDVPQLLRSPSAAEEQGAGKTAALPTADVDTTVSVEGPRGAPAAVAAFAPFGGLKYGRSTGTTTQSTLPHSACVENSICEAWQRNRGSSASSSFSSLRSVDTPVSQERAAGKTTTVDLNRAVGSGASRCIISSSNSDKRPPVPGLRPTSAAAAVSRKEPCAASWAAVAAGGVGGGRRSVASCAGQQQTRSFVNASDHHIGVAGRVNDRRFQNPQNGSSGGGEERQSSPPAGSRERILPSGGGGCGSSTGSASSTGQAKADEAGGVGLSSVTCSVVTRQEDARGGGGITLAEREVQQRHEHHNVDMTAENQHNSSSGLYASCTDPLNTQQGLPGVSSSRSTDYARTAVTARACFNTSGGGWRRSCSSFSGGSHTGTDEEIGGTKNSSSFRGSADAWASRLGGETSSSAETCRDRLGEDNFGLSKLLQLFPLASNQTTGGGLDTLGENIGFPWESRKHPEGRFEQSTYTGTLGTQVDAIQQPLSRGWAVPADSRDGEEKNPWGRGAKSANSSTLPEAEPSSLRGGEGGGGGEEEEPAPAVRGDAFHGDAAKNPSSALSFATEPEEKNKAAAAAAAAASREIAFLIGQWPQGHQQRDSHQCSKQQGDKNTCLAEAVPDGNPREKIQMGVFTETSPLDESVMAAWLPNVGGSPQARSRRPSTCSEQQRSANTFAGSSSTLPGLTETTVGGGRTFLLTEGGISMEADSAFMHNGGSTATGVTSIAKLQERHYSPAPTRVDLEACGGSRLCGNNLQTTSASEPPTIQEQMEKSDNENRFAGFQWPVDEIGATISKETTTLPQQRSAGQQPPLWLQAWANEKDGVASGIRGIDSVEQQMLQRFMLSLEKQRTQRSEGSNCVLSSSSSLDAVANTLRMNLSAKSAATPSSTPPPPPPPPPPALVAAGAFTSEWLQQTGGEQTGERGPAAQQKGDGRTTHSAITSCGSSPTVGGTFQSESGNFLGGIRAPPGLAAREQHEQQQTRRLTETERRTCNASSLSSGTSREQYNKAFSQDSLSLAAQQSSTVEKRKTTRRHDGNYGHGSTHDCFVEEVDSQQERLAEQQRCRHSLPGGEGGGSRNRCTTEQGQQQFRKQQHHTRQSVGSTHPMNSKEAGATNTLEGVGGDSAGIWQLRKVLSDFHLQQRALAARQGIKPPSDASAASAVLTVAQRVAAAAALLRQEQQRAASRSQPPFEAGTASVGDVHKNAMFSSNSSNTFSWTPRPSLGRFSGKEQELISGDRSGIAAVLLGAQKAPAAANAVDRGVDAQVQLSPSAWVAASAYASENVRGLQDEDKIHPREGSQPSALLDESGRHRSFPALVARRSVEETGAYCGSAEGAGKGGLSFGLQRQQQQQQQQQMRSPPLRSPTMPTQQRQRAGGRHAGSRLGYADTTENQYRHTRDGVVRQTLRGLRGTMNAQLRSSSCVPLPPSLSEAEQDESNRGVAMWERVNLVSEHPQAAAAATVQAAELSNSMGAEGSRFVSHERAGIFCFGGRRGEAGELCSEIRVLQGSCPDSFCWSTLPVTGTPPPPCSGMATILALRPASAVSRSASSSSLESLPSASSAEQRKGELSDQEVTVDLDLTAVGQEGRSRAGGGGGDGAFKWDGMETAGMNERRNSSKGDNNMNEKDTLASSGSSQDKLLESSRTLDTKSSDKRSSDKESSDTCGKKMDAQRTSEEGGTSSVSSEREPEGDAREKAGTSAKGLGNSEEDRSEASNMAKSGHKERSLKKEAAAEQHGLGGERRLTLLVYGGRYVDGFADWTSLYECDLTTKTWTRLRVDVSRLFRIDTWHSGSGSSPVGGERTFTARGDISSCSTAALSGDLCVFTSRTKSTPSDDNTALSHAPPPLPGALQESSWCYSELDDCVYVFGGVCRETQLQELPMGMQRDQQQQQQQQQQSQRKQQLQEQQQAEPEKDAEYSGDDMEPSGSEKSRGEGTRSALPRLLPPAWQCQNLLWRFDLGRLQWELVEVGATTTEDSVTTTTVHKDLLLKQHGGVSLPSQSGHSGVFSSAAEETHHRLLEQQGGGSDASQRNSDRNTPQVCSHSSSSPVNCRSGEEKLQHMKQDKADGDVVDGKCDVDSQEHDGGGGDSNTDRAALVPRSSSRSGDAVAEEDEQLTYGEDPLESRSCSFSSLTLPKGRAGHSCVYKDGALWIFGGSSTQEELGDFFRFDLRRQCWEEIKAGSRGDAGRRPSARYGHAATVLGDFMVLFGGYGGKQAFLSDLYTFHFISYTWVKVAAQGAIPAPRFRCGVGTHEGYFFVFAGRGGVQHSAQQQQQPSQQQQPLQRQWSDSSPPLSSGDGAAGGGSGCKRSVVFVDSVRIGLPIDEMLVSHQYVVAQRNEEQQEMQQGKSQREEISHVKSIACLNSSHPDLKKIASKQGFQINTNAALRESERLFDDAALQQRMQVASGGGGGKTLVAMTGQHSLNHPSQSAGSRSSSIMERERSNSMHVFQVERSPQDSLRDVATASHDSERDVIRAAGGTALGATEDERVSAVAAVMLELLRQQATDKTTGGNNLFSSVSRGGEGERANAAPTNEERSRGGGLSTTATTLSRLKAQLQQQLLPRPDGMRQDVAEQQYWGQAEQGSGLQQQDLLRALYARLQDVEQKARTAESEQRRETSVLQEQIRRVSVTLTTLYTKLWNAANEVARGQKENERLLSELAARDAVITRQQKELEALIAKYRHAQVEIALLLKQYQQQGRADGSPAILGNMNLRSGEELSPARAGAAFNVGRAYNVAGLPSASADSSFALQHRLPQCSPPQFPAHLKQDTQR